MKRILVLMASILLMASIVACATTTTTPAVTTATTKAGTTAVGTTAATTTAKATIDTSKLADMKIMVIADRPTDGDLVYGEINKILLKNMNAQLSWEFMSYSNYKEKYSLILASGENLDIIYTSTWCFYAQEATKGAFREITDEMIQKYMPMTWEKEDHVAFDQAHIQNKAYFIPANYPAFNGGMGVAIRGDLRAKYGLKEMTSVADLEAFFDKVVANEKGIFAQAASQNNDQVRTTLFDLGNNFMNVNGLASYFNYKYTGNPVTVADVKWVYDEPEYLAFAKKMKTWADKGYWSKNAIANSTATRDAFENGTSASFFQNIGTVAVSSITINTKNPSWAAEISDVQPAAYRSVGLFTGDGLAVLASSKNWERALMAIDYLKFDFATYQLLRYGIKGTHWTESTVSNKLWKPLNQTGYTFGNGGSWGIKNQMLPYEYDREDQLPVYITLVTNWRANLGKASPLVGFVFDETNVKSEIAALNNAKTKYMYLLDLGLVDNVETALAEFNTQAKAAGLEKIKAELTKQLTTYIAAAK